MFKQAGLTLVELMVSLLLGLMLMSAMLGMFLHSRQSDQLQEELARMQENGRFALELLSYELRMAGSGGCIGPIPTANSISGAPDGWPVGLELPLTGFDSSYRFRQWSSPFKRILRGTDALIVNRIDSSQRYLIDSGADNFSSTLLPLKQKHQLKAGTAIWVSDRNCQQQGLFIHTPENPKSRASKQFSNQINGGKKTHLINCSSQLQGDYDCHSGIETDDSYTISLYAGGQAAPFISNAFYIRPGTDGKTPGLYRRSLSGSVEELVAGIENLQFLYGVDHNQDLKVDQLLAAQQVKDWQQVRTIQIHLLVRSLTFQSEHPAPYQFLGRELLATDRYLRQQHSQTVLLRSLAPFSANAREEG